MRPPGKLVEPQKSPPPPRPDHAQRRSPWSASDFSPLSALKGESAAVTPSQPVSKVHRQSSAKTYRQLDWSLDDSLPTPPAPSAQALKNVSLLAEDSRESDVRNNSDIRVLSTSFEVEGRESPIHHDRSYDISGPLSGGGVVERRVDSRAEMTTVAESLTTLAASHACLLAQGGSAETPFTLRNVPQADGGCQVWSQRIAARQLPTTSSQRGERQSQVVLEAVQELSCTFDVARRVLSQPQARMHWDDHLLRSSVEVVVDKRRVALVQDTRTDRDTAVDSCQLCAVRDESWTGVRGPSTRREALETLAASLVVGAKADVTLSHACIWASTELPEEAFSASGTTSARSQGEDIEANALTAVILLALTSDYRPSISERSAAVTTDRTVVVLLRSSTTPRTLNATKLRDQCQRLAALCRVEQGAVDASSMGMKRSPLRFPKPADHRRAHAHAAGGAAVSSAAALQRYAPVLNARLEDCLRHTPAVGQHTNVEPCHSGPQREVPTIRRARQPAMDAHLAGLVHSPEPRLPTQRTSSMKSSSFASSTSRSQSSSFTSSLSLPLFSGSSSPTRAPATTNEGRERQAEPIAAPTRFRRETAFDLSPAMSHNLDAVSSIQPTGGADASLQVLPYAMSPLAIDTSQEPVVPLVLAGTTAPLTTNALRAHDRLYRRQHTKAPYALVVPTVSSTLVASRQKLKRDYSLVCTGSKAAQRTRQGKNGDARLRITLLCCTGLPRFADDNGDGQYRLSVVARLSRGECAQSEWYPYARDMSFTDKRNAELTNILTCPVTAPTDRDALTMTVVVQTPHKKIRLGVATIHAGHLRAHQNAIFACHMIGKPGTVDAHERCLLQFSILPIHCGLPVVKCVSLVEEARRRQLLWQTVQRRGVPHLHRVEWLVGLCRQNSCTNSDVEAMLRRLVDSDAPPRERRLARIGRSTGDAARRPVSARSWQTRTRHTARTSTASQVHRRHLSPANSATVGDRGLRRSLSLPLLRRKTRTAPLQVHTASVGAPLSPPHEHSGLYAVRLRIGRVGHLCDKQGELLQACVSVFVVVSLNRRPGLRRSRGREALSPSVLDRSVARQWTTSSCAYQHHAAVCADAVVEMDIPDIYDTIARVTVMTGNARCYSVVGYCDVSLRYILGHGESDESATAAGHRFCLYRDGKSSAASDASRWRPVGYVFLSLGCEEASMAHYLPRDSIREARAIKRRHSLAVSALLSRYKPSLLPSLDVQLDQVVARGLAAFVQRKTELWQRPCTLASLATVRVRVLKWSLYGTDTASPLLRDPRRFSAIADPRALILHRRRLHSEAGDRDHGSIGQDGLQCTPSVYVAAHCQASVFATTPPTQSYTEGVNLCAQFGSQLPPLVVNPSERILSLRLLQIVEDGGTDYEVGRVDLPLSVFRVTSVSGGIQRLTLPLTSSAGSHVAYYSGQLSFEVTVAPLEAGDRTGTPMAHSTWRGFDRTWFVPHRLEKLLYYNAPWHLHRLCVLLKDVYTDAEADALLKQCADTFGPAPEGQEQYCVQLVGLRHLAPDVKSCYIKVYDGEKAILRTGTLHVPSSPAGATEDVLTLTGADGGTAMFDVQDVAHGCLRIKLGRSKRLGRNEVIARAQVSLAGANTRTTFHPLERWVSLFDTAETSSRYVGDVCVKLSRVNLHEPRAVAIVPATAQHLVSADQQQRDVVSLLQAYAPHELSRLNTLLATTAPVVPCDPLSRAIDNAPTPLYRTAHVALRALLAPVPVACTVHLSIEGVDLLYDDILPLDVLTGECLQLALSTRGSPIAMCPCTLNQPTSSTCGSTQRYLLENAGITSVARLDVPAPLALDDGVADQTALDIVLEHTNAWARQNLDGMGGVLRGRLGSGAAAAAASRSNSAASRRTSVSRTPSAAASRASSLSRDTASHRGTAATARSNEGATLPMTTTAVPVGQCRLSLRALLTPELYAKGEVISVALVCSARTLGFRLTGPQRQHFDQALVRHGVDTSETDLFVLGHLRLSARVAGGDRVPSWLQLSRNGHCRDTTRWRNAAAQAAARCEAARDMKALVCTHYTSYESALPQCAPPSPRSDSTRPTSSFSVRRTRSAATARGRPKGSQRISPPPRRPRTPSSNHMPESRTRQLGDKQSRDSASESVSHISTPSWTVYSRQTVVSQQWPNSSAWTQQVVRPRESDQSLAFTADGAGLTFLVSPSTIAESRSVR